MARTTRWMVTTAAAVVVAAAVAFAAVPPQSAVPRGRSEQLELLGVTATKLRALAEARQAGTFGQAQEITGRAAPGWAGEQVVSGVRDDWEPAVAADPVDPFVYMLTTRFGDPKPCQGNCPIPHISLTSATTAGGRGGRPVRSARARGRGSTTRSSRSCRTPAHVYAVYLNGFNVVFVELGGPRRTWSAPVRRTGTCRGTTSRPSRRATTASHVYVSWNGPTGGDPWIAQSHDFGRTWTQTEARRLRPLLLRVRRRRAHDGTVVFAQSELHYSGPGGAAEGVVHHHAVHLARPRGTWQDHVVRTGRARASRARRPAATRTSTSGTAACPPTATTTWSSVYDGAPPTGRAAADLRRRSTDGGRTWSARGPAVDARRERDLARGRGARQRRRPRLVHADADGESRTLERLLPAVDRRRRHVEAPVEDLGRDAGAALQARRRVPRDLRRLRRDRDHERGQRRSRSGARGSATTAPAGCGSTGRPSAYLGRSNGGTHGLLGEVAEVGLGGWVRRQVEVAVEHLVLAEPAGDHGEGRQHDFLHRHRRFRNRTSSL